MTALRLSTTRKNLPTFAVFPILLHSRPAFAPRSAIAILPRSDLAGVGLTTGGGGHVVQDLGIPADGDGVHGGPDADVLHPQGTQLDFHAVFRNGLPLAEGRLYGSGGGRAEQGAPRDP